MSKTPDWPSLWEREPGLRPNFKSELGCPACGYEALWPPSLAVAMREWAGQIKECPDHHTGYAYAALCRDASVRWLGKIDTLLIQEFNITGPMWKLSMPYGHEPFGGNFSTLDEALYAACSAILDARDAAQLKSSGRSEPRS